MNKSLPKDPTNTNITALPAGWTEASPGGLATNSDPANGGIVDKNMAGLGWFVIFHRRDLDMVEGLPSREEAFRVFAERMA